MSSATVDYCQACDSYYLTITQHAEYCDGVGSEEETDPWDD